MNRAGWLQDRRMKKFRDVRLIAKRAATDVAGQSIQFAKLRRLVGDRRACCRACRACCRAGCSRLVNLTTDRLN